MEALKNLNPIQEIVELLPNIKGKIEKTSNEMDNYLEVLKDEKFIEKENEREEEAIKRAEGIFDRLDEIVQRRRVVMQNGKETIEFINEVKLKLENVVKSCEDDEIHLEKANDDLIDKIIDLKERKRKRDIKPFQDKIDEINKQFNKEKNELEGNLVRKKKEEEERKKKDEEIRKQEEEKMKRMSSVIDNGEIKQIEEWTSLKIGNIIFDSSVDNWNQYSSVFDEKVINKNNLIFLIEDTDGNKFGSYVSVAINNYNSINDSKSFLFSLKSNGRLNGMFKFDITNPQTAFYLYNKSDNSYLFHVGPSGDFVIYKENSKTQSYCNQTNYFNYNGIQQTLCGKQNFIPKRITVIQLI